VNFDLNLVLHYLPDVVKMCIASRTEGESSENVYENFACEIYSAAFHNITIPFAVVVSSD